MAGCGHLVIFATFPVLRLMTIFRLFAFLPILCFGQNLVLNPGFGQIGYCPKGIGQFKNNVVSWSLPTLGTSDIFSACGKAEAGVPQNAFGNQDAESDGNYAGLYMLLPNDLREYLQGRFSQPLVEGKRYTVSMWVSLAEHSDYAVNSFAVLFTQNQLSIRSSDYIRPSEVEAASAGVHQVVAIPHPAFLSDRKNWMRISATFIAKGGERYFSIGNFKSNEATVKKFVKSQTDNTSYYYIDSVIVEAEQLQQTAVLEPDKTYTLPVSFQFDSSEITPEAEAKLEEIIAFLEAHPQSHIEISGHTDDVGSESYNQEISLKRVRSVVEFLVERQVKPERIRTFGYGESQPIGDNGTEEGRSQNRRVEFVLSD